MRGKHQLNWTRLLCGRATSDRLVANAVHLACFIVETGRRLSQSSGEERFLPPPHLPVLALSRGMVLYWAVAQSIGKPRGGGAGPRRRVPVSSEWRWVSSFSSLSFHSKAERLDFTPDPTDRIWLERSKAAIFFVTSQVKESTLLAHVQSLKGSASGSDADMPANQDITFSWLIRWSAGRSLWIR